MAAARSPRLAGAEARYDGFVLQSVAPTAEIPASNNILESVGIFDSFAQGPCLRSAQSPFMIAVICQSL